jgi:hypothetical protein
VDLSLVPAGSSTWAFTEPDQVGPGVRPIVPGTLHAVAVLEAPYLFFVTDNDPYRAMRVAQAAVAELESWEPDPNYVCGLFESASVQVNAFEQYPTGDDSLSEVCEAEQGSALNQLHLLWRLPATTLEDAAQLMETADDLPLPGSEGVLAEVDWEAFTAGMWIGYGVDAGDTQFFAVAVSTDPYFFVVTHGDRADALEIALGVFNEVIERRPSNAP